MENRPLTKPIIQSASLIVGLCLLGFFIFKGLKTFSDKDRIVTVKGLAEMNITATAASISVSFPISGDNLQEVIKQTDAKKNAIISYLKTVGYNQPDIQISNLDINDRQKYYENEWQGNQQVKVKIDRYIITQTLNIQSKDIKSNRGQSFQDET